MNDVFPEIADSSVAGATTSRIPIRWPWTRVSVDNIATYHTQWIASPDPQTLLKEVEEIRQRGRRAVSTLELSVDEPLQVEAMILEYTNKKLVGVQSQADDEIQNLLDLIIVTDNGVETVDTLYPRVVDTSFLGKRQSAALSPHPRFAEFDPRHPICSVSLRGCPIFS